MQHHPAQAARTQTTKEHNLALEESAGARHRPLLEIIFHLEDQHLFEGLTPETETLDNKQSAVPGPGQELGSFLHLICNFHQVIITTRLEPPQHQRANWNAMKP